MAMRNPSPKMLRFLDSIDVSLKETFVIDMDFSSIRHDPSDASRILLSIAKEKPWELPFLDAFLNGLSSIDYPYGLSFTYDVSPRFEDLANLFQNWYFEHYFSFSPFELLEGDGNAVYLSFHNEGEKKKAERVLKDFSGLLQLISYPFELSLKDLSAKSAPNEKKPEQKTEAPKLETPIASEPEPSSLSVEEEKAEQAFEATPAFPQSEETEEEDKEEEEEGDSEENGQSLSSGESLSSEEADAREEERISHEQALRAAEEAELTRMDEYRKEEERKKIYLRGNYELVEHLKDLYSKEGNVAVYGEIEAVDTKVGRSGKTFSNFVIGRLGDGAIRVRAAVFRQTITEDLLNSLKSDMWLNVRGALERDERTGQLGIFAHYIEKADAPALRTDPSPRKRVELHLHTKMSAMDGLGDISSYINTALSMGMRALAITDHGNLQAFPLAETALAGIKKAKPDTDFRIIYGVEFYAFKKQRYIFNPCEQILKGARYCVFDFETTGLSHIYDRVTEFGAVLVEGNNNPIHEDFFVDAGVPIPENVQRKTHITNEMIRGQLSEAEAVERIDRFLGDENTIMVSHNAPFDIGFLNAMRKRVGKPPIKNPVIDTLALSYYMFPEAGSHNLGALCRSLKLDIYSKSDAHRADYDAGVLFDAWNRLRENLEKKLGNPALRHCDLADLKIDNRKVYKHLKSFHVTCLVRNQEGLKDLYRLVSKSETEYMALGATPKIDRDDLEKKRANLLFGSACFNGEVFRAASEKSQEELEEAMRFYDYIELQPLENYSYLVDTEQITQERLLDILKNIYKTALKLGKRVVATGDCHYVNPEEKSLRDIYINAKMLGGGFHPLHYSHREELHNPNFASPDQHFRSTAEMIESFEKWMSKEEAEKIVIDESNAIADLCDGPIKILKDRLYTPDANLPGSADKLRAICYENLKKAYGDNPPTEVKERLEKELAGIINNGYSVTYYIAHLLIKWANSKDFFVGSRGSVGSSFAATMAGITEVDPLKPHYVCPKCHHFEWAEDPSARCGFDLPAKKCPECGTPMVKNGQSIPFETFLGFHAEKVPDIDLNFPQDRLGLAHDETRLLLSTPEENEAYARGESVESPHVIRAGTIAKAESKNCFGYVKTYYQDVLHESLTPDLSAYISYLSEKATGVKRTTGQHPGGIVVIPADMEIFDFTPYQFPADDPTAGWLTTHFDFSSMHDSVLKLDELGHVDPMALRIMHELTGINFRTLPMDDPKVLSLFSSPKALKLKENRLAFKTGAVALPEFGTNFVQGLLEEAKPRTFNDLLIISGLSHGTNVWQSNAEDLIRQGKSLEQVIGCRDDIMNYLIQMGLESGIAFKIMEFVRKNKAGKPIPPEYEEAMRKAKVPEWYIESCRKIRYLFPRAHATAYVMAAVRVAWYKLYCPLEFYATYFFTRCHSFDVKILSSGIDAVEAAIKDTQARALRRETNDTDDEKMKSYMAAIEMFERGYSIRNVSLMESDATMWKVDKEHNAVIPPFTAIPNFNQRSAEGIVAARKEGPFLSKEDLKTRVRNAKDEAGVVYSIGDGVISILDEIGALEGLGESNQMSLFDFSF